MAKQVDLGSLIIRVQAIGARQASTDLKVLADSADKAAHRANLLQQAFATMGGVLGAQAIGKLAAIPGIITQAAGATVQLSNEFESIRIGLESITGSAERAERKMAFIKALAIPSEMTVRQLAEAGQMIEGMGLNLERVLPLITKLTMGTRRTDEMHIRMAAGSLFGRLAAGMRPELHTLSAFGISQAGMERYGAVFGKNGELLSSAEETLNAIERLIEDRFGKALILAANSGMARMSALADIWEQTLARVGDAVKRFVLPMVDRLSDWLKFATQSGWLEGLVQRLGSAMGIIGENMMEPVDRIVSLLMAAADHLPEALQAVGTTIAKVLTVAARELSAIIANLDLSVQAKKLDRAVTGLWPAWTFGQKMPPWLGAIPGIGPAMQLAFGSTPTKAEVLARKDAEVQALVERTAERTAARLAQIEAEIAKPGKSVGMNIGEAAQRYMRMFAEWRARQPGGVQLPESNAGWFNASGIGGGDEAAEIASASRATARNTRETAEILRDLRVTWFGGGPRLRGSFATAEVEIALARALGTGLG